MDQSCQLQPTSFCSDANETVAQQAASSAGRTDDNNAHSMNNGEWTHEKKSTDFEKRQKGNNFMKRIKDRWYSEYPEKRRTAQNLGDSICRFAKEGWRAEISRNQITEMQKSTG